MIDRNSIYQNPLISEGYYFVKVIEIETEQVPEGLRPRIFVRLRVHPDHGVGDNVILTTIIHPTDASRFHYLNFMNTFLAFHEDDPMLAINRWGKVYVYHEQYQETKYTAIKFVYQKIQVRLSNDIMNNQEREGKTVTLPVESPRRTIRIQPGYSVEKAEQVLASLTKELLFPDDLYL